MISLENIWPEWKIEKQIGRGSFGIVYQAVRQDENSLIRRAAIKVISIPQDPYEIEMLRADGMDRNACHTYIKNIVDDSVNEIRLMESLQEDSQNIVRIEDYKVMEKTATIGWDIYIRMELLTPFNVYICDKKMSEQEVIQLGCDICNALEVCERSNIIHRDIKPENIFINELGSFKIGDFGTARTLESLTVSLSQKGTYNYMAPEVFKGELYDARVDIYSLGIVLYRLLNGNRLPFLSEKQLLSPAERRTALDRRLSGEKLPAPSEASAPMAEVIVQSCAFDPDERFSSAIELREALQKLDKDFNSKAVPDLINCGEKPVAAKRFLQVSMIVFAIIFLTGCMWFVFKKELYEIKDDEQEALKKTGDEEMVSKTGIRTIESLSVKSEPVITLYRKGDTLRTNGLMLNAEYSDGSNEIIWKDFTCSPTVFEENGPRDIVVSYEGLSTKFHVLVIDGYDMERSYYILENFGFADLEVVSRDLPLKNLDIRCTSAILDAGAAGVGYDEYGMPVDRCLRFEFDLPEHILGMSEQMIYCSWNHVKLPGDNDDWIDDGIEKYTWELKESGITYCDTEIIPEVLSLTGKPRLVYRVFLPDDYGLKGEQLVILQVGNMKRAIHFSLDYVYGYPGNYRNGNGWIIYDVSY